MDNQGKDTFPTVNELNTNQQFYMQNPIPGFQQLGVNPNSFQQMNPQYGNTYPYSSMPQNDHTAILQNILNINLQLLDSNNKLVFRLNEMEKKLDQISGKSGKTNINLSIDSHSVETPDQTQPTIMKKEEEFVMNQWFGFEPHYKLLYRSSEHGKRPLDFHTKCDNKGPTITFIETLDGFRFGGYTNLDWDCSGDYKRNGKNNFLFSLDKMRRLSHSHGKGEIMCEASRGPTFGRGYDLEILDNLQGQQNVDAFGENEKQSFFTGSFDFTAKLIEVYSVTTLK